METQAPLFKGGVIILGAELWVGTLCLMLVFALANSQFSNERRWKQNASNHPEQQRIECKIAEKYYQTLYFKEAYYV